MPRGTYIERPSCTTPVSAVKESEVHMRKKSQANLLPEEALEHISEGKIDESMVVYITKDGDRVYLHSFENKIHALEFLEIMVAGLRADILESIEMRSLN